MAYYPFNGNAKDESGNGNDGELGSAVLASGRDGNQIELKAFNIDGSPKD